ncbi:hypothetical protein LC593_33460 [Nostoc sp. CHAB 5844]|nr:hypothetical protein [Nostoc sp. CHAB 5844]
MRDCRQSRRQSPQVEPVRCGESALREGFPPQATVNPKGGSKSCSNWRGRAFRQRGLGVSPKTALPHHGAVSPTHCRRSYVEDRYANTTAVAPQPTFFASF